MSQRESHINEKENITELERKREVRERKDREIDFVKKLKLKRATDQVRR